MSYGDDDNLGRLNAIDEVIGGVLEDESAMAPAVRRVRMRHGEDLPDSVFDRPNEPFRGSGIIGFVPADRS